MKKLTLKLEGIKEMLTREQMKKVVGGSGSGGGNRYQCCPGPGDGGIGCSSCVTVPDGSTASCTLGTLTRC